jgi:hypothetical protein
MCSHFSEAVAIRNAAIAPPAIEANAPKSAIRSVKEHRQQSDSAQGDDAVNEIFEADGNFLLRTLKLAYFVAVVLI